MDELIKLVTALQQAKIAAENIIKKLDPVSKNLKDANHEIVQEAVKKYPAHAKTIQKCMQEVVVDWMSDALHVKADYDGITRKTDDGFIIDFSGGSFMSEVYNGDTYDKQGVDGIIALESDLKTQFNTCDRAKLLSTAVAKLSQPDTSQSDA